MIWSMGGQEDTRSSAGATISFGLLIAAFGLWLVRTALGSFLGLDPTQALSSTSEVQSPHSKFGKAESFSIPSEKPILPPTPKVSGIAEKLSIYDAHQNLRLARLYGPVITLKDGSSIIARCLRRFFLRSALPWSSSSSETVILLSSASSARQLLESKGADYSSRGFCIPAGKYLSDNRRIVLQQYGPLWRSHHKALVQVLLKDKIKNRWRRALRHEALVLINNIASSVDTEEKSNGAIVLDEVSRFTSSSVLQIAYARRAQSIDDPVLKDLEQVSQQIADAFTPDKYIVEKYPFLDLLPVWLASWKRKLKKDHEFEARVYGGLIDDVDRRLKNKDAQSSDSEITEDSIDHSVIKEDECCAAELLACLEASEDRPTGGLDRKDISYICATVFEAGSETTAMTINTFLLSAALHPSIVQLAQAELDEAVCSKSFSLPTFDLMPHLPYVCALIKEVLRMTPTGSTGVAHASSRTTSDIVEIDNRKWVIPAGATILPNIYGIHHDREIYVDPWTFDPTRFLLDQSERKSTLQSVSAGITQDHHAFGFGRRICPGLDLASNSLFISVCHLLWAFDFSLNKARVKTLSETIHEAYRSDRVRFEGLFSPSKVDNAASKDEMDDLPMEALLLDAYTNHKLSRQDLASCISLKVRDANRIDQARTSLGRIHDEG